LPARAETSSKPNQPAKIYTSKFVRNVIRSLQANKNLWTQLVELTASTSVTLAAGKKGKSKKVNGKILLKKNVTFCNQLLAFNNPNAESYSGESILV
jgi:hypothetical protein